MANQNPETSVTIKIPTYQVGTESLDKQVFTTVISIEVTPSDTDNWKQVIKGQSSDSFNHLDLVFESCKTSNQLLDDCQKAIIEYNIVNPEQTNDQIENWEFFDVGFSVVSTHSEEGANTDFEYDHAISSDGKTLTVAIDRVRVSEDTKVDIGFRFTAMQYLQQNLNSDVKVDKTALAKMYVSQDPVVSVGRPKRP